MRQTDALLRRTEVEQRCHISCTALYRLMRSEPPQFPLPLKIGPRKVRWLESEIEAWLASRPRATGEGREVIAK